MVDLVIKPAAFKFLVNQRGEFARYADNYQAWARQYHRELQKTFDQIGYGGVHCLDIGSGLGAIDVVLMRAHDTHCTLIDGEDGDGVAKKYDVPFCNREVVQQFMYDNAINPKQWEYVSPPQMCDTEFPLFDLVISLRSWCFHYPPDEYLLFVQQHCPAGCRIILDVRNNRKEWRKQLQQAFREVHVIETHTKFDRVLYVTRGMMQ